MPSTIAVDRPELSQNPKFVDNFFSYPQFQISQHLFMNDVWRAHMYDFAPKIGSKSYISTRQTMYGYQGCPRGGSRRWNRDSSGWRSSRRSCQRQDDSRPRDRDQPAGGM